MLRDNEGRWMDKEEDIKKVIMQFNQSLFEEENWEGSIAKISSFFLPMDDILVKIPNSEEI